MTHPRTLPEGEQNLGATERSLAVAAMPLRSRVESDAWYEGIDPGIRYAVRVLHAAGIETSQSCQGGEGHSYEWPTIDLPDGPRDAAGFAALHHLNQHGLGVFAISRVWNVEQGMPYQSVWRVELRCPIEERVDERPMFVWGYRANPVTDSDGQPSPPGVQS
jgi:hypothetical protein